MKAPHGICQTYEECSPSYDEQTLFSTSATMLLALIHGGFWDNKYSVPESLVSANSHFKATRGSRLASAMHRHRDFQLPRLGISITI